MPIPLVRRQPCDVSLLDSPGEDRDYKGLWDLVHLHLALVEILAASLDEK